MATDLTIFLAPRGAADGVLDVLTDLSAAGLLDRFLWVAGEAVTAESADAVAVEGGARRAVTVQAALADQAPERVRLCVVVSVTGDGAPVGTGTEQRLYELVTFVAGATPVTRIRCVLARVGDRTSADNLERGGWHNVLLAPEDGVGPTGHRLPLPHTSDPVEIGRHGAPMIAGIVGLWSGVSGCALDDVPPGQGARAGRAFYRQLDARSVETELQRQILSTTPELPLPQDSSGKVVRIEEVGLACRNMVNAWWARHKDSLISRRESAVVQEKIPEDWRTILKWLFKFIGAALRTAIPDWLEGERAKAAQSFAQSVQRLALGSTDSAYEVVVKGQTKDGPVDWNGRARAVAELAAALPPDGAHQHSGRADQTPIWEDYAARAFTLADGGERPGVAPARVGDAHFGVLRSVADCVPSPDQAFADIPGRVQASTRVTQLAAGDVVGAGGLRDKLRDLRQRTPNMATDVDSTMRELATWEERHSHSYSVQVGRCLFGNLAAVYEEIQRYLEDLRRIAEELAAERPPQGGRWLVRVLLALAIVAPVVAVVLGMNGTISTGAAWALGVVPLVVWLTTVVVQYSLRQRDLFADMNRRRELLNAAEAARLNLRRAMFDVGRLTEAYQHYLLWSRIIGAILHRPFGPPPADPEVGVRIAFGLPRAVNTGRARVHLDAMKAVASELRSSPELFPRGWLSQVWQGHCAAAGSQLDSHDLTNNPSRLFEVHDGLQGSHLQQWASVLSTEGTTAATGSARWEKARELLRGSHSHLGATLLRAVDDGDRDPVTMADFMSGIDSDVTRLPRQPIGLQVFTPAAKAAERHMSALSDARVAGDGLSVTVALVQFTETRPAYEFAAVADADGEHPVGSDEPVSAQGPFVPEAPLGFSSVTPTQAGQGS